LELLDRGAAGCPFFLVATHFFELYHQRLVAPGPLLEYKVGTGVTGQLAISVPPPPAETAAVDSRGFASTDKVVLFGITASKTMKAQTCWLLLCLQTMSVMQQPDLADEEQLIYLYQVSLSKFGQGHCS